MTDHAKMEALFKELEIVAGFGAGVHVVDEDIPREAEKSMTLVTVAFVFDKEEKYLGYYDYEWRHWTPRGKNDDEEE